MAKVSGVPGNGTAHEQGAMRGGNGVEHPGAIPEPALKHDKVASPGPALEARTRETEANLQSAIRNLPDNGKSVDSLDHFVQQYGDSMSELAEQAKYTNPQAAASRIHDMARSVSGAIDETTAKLDHSESVLRENDSPGQSKIDALENIAMKRSELRGLKLRVKNHAGNLREGLLGRSESKTACMHGPVNRAYISRPWVVATLASTATVLTLALIGALSQKQRKPKLLVIRERSPVPPLAQPSLPQPRMAAQPIIIQQPRPQHARSQQQPIIEVVFPNTNSLN